MDKLSVPTELIEFIGGHTDFLILSHLDPDGDCIGSSLALGAFLKRIGKTCGYYNVGPFGRREILEFEEKFSPEIKEDNHRKNSGVIILDCSTVDRIGSLAEQIVDRDIAVIDHHSSGEDFGTVRFINPTAPSTSLLVQQVIEEMGYSPTLEESEYIFFAFTTDTGFFRHLGSHTNVTFEFVAKLVEAGVSPKKIYDRISGGVSHKSRQHLGLLLNRSESFFGGQFLYTWETYRDIQKYGRENRDSDTLYQQLMNVAGTELLLVLREEKPGKTTGSFRSAEKIDCGKLAASLGGGGHARAAGFSIEKNLDECLSEVFPKTEQALMKTK